MQLRHPSPDAFLSFSDFLLERFGLVASMQVSFVVSVAIHAALIIGLGFGVADWRKWAAPHNLLEVVLVNAKTASKPTKADALAQANLDGGGNTDEKLRAKTPLPALEAKRPTYDLKQTEEYQKQLELQAKQLMTQLKSQAQVAQPEVAPKAEKKDEVAKELLARQLEIERLEAQIKREHQAYQERPRKTFIGARASEYRFAQYVDNWRLKIERIGNLNYPDEARQRKIYGSLQLSVGIRPNGEIESVEITKKSGSRILDQAALRIVRLAAPFDQFPESIRKDTDILYIVRTWTFTRNDQVLAE